MTLHSARLRSGGGHHFTAIHIFPKFVNESAIQTLRAKYDPLFSLIPPHITLVFPVDTALSNEELEYHLQKAVADFQSFQVLLQGVTGTPDGYLFLNVKRGNDEIIALHDKLYTGPLQRYLNRTLTYCPHLTVGKFDNEQSFQAALTETETFIDRFETVVNEIAFERISPTGQSHIEAKITIN